MILLKVHQLHYPMLTAIIIAGYLVYMIFLCVQLFLKNIAHQHRVEYLLKHGIKIEINLLNSLEKIIEYEIFEEKDSISTSTLFDGGLIGDLHSETKKNDCISVITLVFEVDKKQFSHDISLRMRAEDVRRFFIFTKKTILIYNPRDPNDCIVDTKFAE